MHLISTLCIVMALSGMTASSGNCPEEYLRLSPDHTFCKDSIGTCKMLQIGVSQSDIPEILDAHNKFRSKVAMGKEERARGLPTAANMLQLSWDAELAIIAQRWAQQCKFGHDCGGCRDTSRFEVGQNILMRSEPCTGGVCPNESPDWPGVIESFYDEVEIFDKSMVKSVLFDEGYTSHFTQVVWAKTYKVGCGYMEYEEYEENGFAKKLYVCNYGPSGNIEDFPLYEEGPPCSACPKDSCCGSACGSNSYPGLCKV